MLSLPIYTTMDDCVATQGPPQWILCHTKGMTRQHTVNCQMITTLSPPIH